MVRVCMFDMGGVVDEFSSEVMEKQILADLGVSDASSFVELCPALQPVLGDFLRGMMDEAGFWRQFGALTGLRVPKRSHLYTKYFAPVKKMDTIRLISDLRVHGMRVVAATNVEPPHRIWHETQGDYDIFDAAYTSDVLHVAKPEAAFFVEVVRREGLAPQECFFTDDREENIDAALSVGMVARQFVCADDLRRTLANISVL
ncbi:MAG: HAD-IA family hydrolase [Sphaerochaetaceae bacterium]|jgi:FMN phosphatase YigB (HAD superfamily)